MEEQAEPEGLLDLNLGIILSPSHSVPTHTFVSLLPLVPLTSGKPHTFLNFSCFLVLFIILLLFSFRFISQGIFQVLAIFMEHWYSQLDLGGSCGYFLVLSSEKCYSTIRPGYRSIMPGCPVLKLSGLDGWHSLCQ